MKPNGEASVSLEVGAARATFELFLLHVFTAHAARFYFPRTTLGRLQGASPALRAAISAVACRVTPPRVLPPGADLRAHERAFALVAEDALSTRCADAGAGSPLELVQAHALLANLMYMNGRALDGHRHAGGALRLATSLGLHRVAAPGERAETWWMVFALDRAWAGVFGAQSSTLHEGAVCAPFPDAADASHLGHLHVAPHYGIPLPPAGSHPARLGAARMQMLALHARACDLVAHARDGYPLPRVLTPVAGQAINPFTATLTALDRLAQSLTDLERSAAVASVRIEAYAAIVSLNAVQDNRDGVLRASRSALAEVDSLSSEQMTMLDPLVAFSLANIKRAWRDMQGNPSELAPLSSALERLSDSLPFTRLKSGSTSGQTLHYPLPTHVEPCRA